SAPDPMLYDPVASKNGKVHHCRKNYILLISDGLSFEDNDALMARDPQTGVNVDLRSQATLYDSAVSLSKGSDQYAYAKDLSDPTEDPQMEMIDGTTYETHYIPNASALPIVGQNGTYHAD